MITTVKKRTGKAGYHHGALRESLIAAAERLIEERGPEGFTLKDASKLAGVSVAAPYRHFTDRADLLDAVAEKGFRTLSEKLRAACQAHVKGSVASWVAMGQAYVQFVAGTPNLSRLMFDHREDSPTGHHVPSRQAASAEDDKSPAQKAGEACFGILLENVDDFLEVNGRAEEDPLPLALPLWTIVHGTASLVIDKNFDHLAPDTDTDRLVRDSTRHFLAGYLASQDGRGDDGDDDTGPGPNN